MTGRRSTGRKPAVLILSALCVLILLSVTASCGVTGLGWLQGESSESGNWDLSLIVPSSTGQSSDPARPDISEVEESIPSGNVSESSPDGGTSEAPAYKTLTFRTKKLLNDHYTKHGIEMGFSSAEAYQKAACAVVNNPDALHKLEAEDGDDVYYVESTNEFVVVSKDGYIRTYFLPSGGKAYYDRQ